MLASSILAGSLVWFALRTTQFPYSSPERLVAAFRLVQNSALLLTFVSGIHVGLAASTPSRPGTRLSVIVAVVFFLIAALAMTT